MSPRDGSEPRYRPLQLKKITLQLFPFIKLCTSMALVHPQDTHISMYKKQ
jgi:hypothetical protein